MSEKLKPCPFCGATPELISGTIADGNHLAFIQCPQCECSIRLCETEEEAINAWNSRIQVCD